MLVCTELKVQASFYSLQKHHMTYKGLEDISLFAAIILTSDKDCGYKWYIRSTSVGKVIRV